MIQKELHLRKGNPFYRDEIETTYTQYDKTISGFNCIKVWVYNQDYWRISDGKAVLYVHGETIENKIK